MGFKFNNLLRPPVAVEFLPHENVSPGEGLEMEINLDLLTLEKMEELDEEFRRTVSDLKQSEQNPVVKTSISETAPDTENAEIIQAAAESEPESLSLFHFDKANIRFKARSLGGNPGEDNPAARFIRSWKMSDSEGNPIPVSYEFLVKFPKTVLDRLYDFVTNEASKPTKKNDEQ